MSNYDVARTQLARDVKAVLADSEELLKAVGEESKEKIATVRPRVEASIQRARTKLAELEASVGARAREAVHSADAYAHEHPWRAVSIAAAAGAALGAIFGVLIARR